MNSQIGMSVFSYSSKSSIYSKSLKKSKHFISLMQNHINSIVSKKAVLLLINNLPFNYLNTPIDIGAIVMLPLYE